MAPPLIVRAILDTAAYFKAAEGVNSVNAGMGASALTMGSDFTKSSSEVVAAGVKVAESLQAQVDEYGRLAKAAEAGSVAQKVAAVQGERAQLALNRTLGITATGTSKVAAEAQKGERDLGKLSRGALAGSGVFSKLGRSLAFASTGFIAVAGGATVIAESIRQAEGLAAAQRQVDRQLQTSGKSWSQYGSRIDSVLLKEGHLAGFTRSDLLQAFGYLIRVGGNVSRSLNLTALAADVARGRSISLQAASIALSKALGGSATALRRLGIIVPKNVTTMQALAYVQQKFTGQAKAGTTQSERLGASLADAGATIGTVLLPTFDRIAGSISKFLTRMQESGQLTRDVTSVTHLLGLGFHALGDIIGTVDNITGSFGHTLLLIGEIWGTIKIAGWIRTLGALAVEWGLVASAAEKAAAAEAAAAAVSSAGIATGDLRAAGLVSAEAGGAGMLGRLGGLGAAGRFGVGAGFAIGGQILGQVAGSAIGGSTGRGVSNTLQFAGLGAGIGTAIAPGVGTAVGAGLGALVGAVTGFIHAAPSFNQQAVQMAQNVTKLGSAAKQTSSQILGLQTSIASGRVGRDEAQQALRQAEAQEKATRGTSAHANAVDKLAAAQLNLKSANAQLVTLEDQLTTAEKRHTQEQKTQQRQAAALVNQLADIQRQVLHPLAGEGRQESPAFAMLSPLEKYISKLTDLQQALQKTDPPMAKVVKRLIAITSLMNGMPTAKELRLTIQAAIHGQSQPFTTGHGPLGSPTTSQPPPGPTGPAPVVKWSAFQLTLTEQIMQAKAALTKTTADDVAVAKGIIARIKSLIDRGKLDNKALIQALQEESSAESTIASAAAARKQAAQQAAAAAKAAASTYNVPAALQLAQAKAEAYGKSETGILKKIIAAAQHAINAGGKNWQGLVAAYQVIAQARSQLEQDAQAAIIPLKLQLALAKAQATGADQTGILKKMKAALEKALKAAKGNVQKQIDIWNQIAQINSQLGSSVDNAYGDYKKASLKWETQGLGLTPAQRRALEANLAQVGPGGTRPMSGTGAAGYVIDPDTGRPIHRGHRRQGSQYSRGGVANTPTVNANIDLKVFIDGKQVEAVVTKRQQKSNTRRPTQRRGPHAATR